MSKSVIELCACKPNEMLGASLFCPHSLARYENKIRDEYLTTLAANLDAGGLDAAYDAIRLIKCKSSIDTVCLTAIKAYLNAIKEEKK